VPAGAVGVLSYLVESRLGHEALDALLADLEDHSLQLDSGAQDIPRVRELIGRYGNLPLGFVVAVIIACAERKGGRMLSLDPDFHVVAREGALSVVPE
jgi:hypothetical protein